MSLAAEIEKFISGMDYGNTFTYAQLGINPAQYSTAAKALERLQKKGLIKRLSKGIFYKPEQSVFGELKPNDEEVIRTYLFENGKRVAYLTGTYLYNKMMLTTQVPNVWKIASFNSRIFVNRQNIKAKPVKAYAQVTENNYSLLGFLDALKDWNNIPDLNSSSGVKLMTNTLLELKPKQLKSLTEYALLYPPRVSAFLGALLESLNVGDPQKLKLRINPLTTYNIRLTQKDLPTIVNWNIR